MARSQILLLLFVFLASSAYPSLSSFLSRSASSASLVRVPLPLLRNTSWASRVENHMILSLISKLFRSKIMASIEISCANIKINLKLKMFTALILCDYLMFQRVRNVRVLMYFVHFHFVDLKWNKIIIEF